MFNMVKDHRATELIILLATKDRLHSFHDTRWELQHGSDQQAGERYSQIWKGMLDGNGGGGWIQCKNQPLLPIRLFVFAQQYFCA